MELLPYAVSPCRWFLLVAITQHTLPLLPAPVGALQRSVWDMLWDMSAWMTRQVYSWSSQKRLNDKLFTVWIIGWGSWRQSSEGAALWCEATQVGDDCYGETCPVRSTSVISLSSVDPCTDDLILVLWPSLPMIDSYYCTGWISSVTKRKAWGTALLWVTLWWMDRWAISCLNLQFKLTDWITLFFQLMPECIKLNRATLSNTTETPLTFRLQTSGAFHVVEMHPNTRQPVGQTQQTQVITLLPRQSAVVSMCNDLLVIHMPIWS